MPAFEIIGLLPQIAEIVVPPSISRHGGDFTSKAASARAAASTLDYAATIQPPEFIPSRHGRPYPPLCNGRTLRPRRWHRRGKRLPTRRRRRNPPGRTLIPLGRRRNFPVADQSRRPFLIDLGELLQINERIPQDANSSRVGRRDPISGSSFPLPTRTGMTGKNPSRVRILMMS